MTDGDGSGGGPPPDPENGADRPEYFPGEKQRRVPKAAWWVLGIACVLLLLLFVVRPSWFTRSADDDSLHVPANRHFTKSVAGLGDPDGLWLDDDAPSTTFSVPIPVDSTPSHTRLHLLGDTQVPQDSTAFLSVVIDGDQVYRGELPRGDQSLDQLVDVPGAAGDDGTVRVQVRMDGNLHNQACAADHLSGANIHIAPNTVVEAALDRPLRTVRDVVSSWDRDIAVVLPDRTDPWRTVAAQLGIGLTQAGHQVRFTDRMPDSDVRNVVIVGPEQSAAALGWTASSPESVAVGSVSGTAVLGLRSGSAADATRLVTGAMASVADSPGADPRHVPATGPAGDSIALSDLGADLSTASITEAHSWRVSYSLPDLPGGRLPQAVRVAWLLPASPPDLTWILNTSINGRLVDSRRLNGAPAPLIPLPASLERVDNTLTFSVQRDRDMGGCDVRETKYSIAMDPASALTLGADAGQGFVSLPRILAPNPTVYVPDVSGDTTTLLNAVVPVIADFVSAGVSPEFAWGAGPAPGQPFIQVGTSSGVVTPLTVANGRLVSVAPPAVDVNSITNGIIVSTGLSGNVIRGLVIQPVGDGNPGALPQFGQEAAQIVTSHGSVATGADGIPLSSDPPRTTPGG